MAYGSTYTWSQVGEFARNMGAKKIQVGTYDVMIAEAAANLIYTYFPWQFSLVNFFNSILLVPGQQDYPAPADMYRLTQSWIHVVYQPDSPDQFYNLNVQATLTPDLNPTGFYGNGNVAFMKNFGILRLANAAQVVNQPQVAYLEGEYQPKSVKVTDMGQYLPMPDEYYPLAVEAYLYWLYKFGDDSRAGTMVKQGGAVEYTGQLAVVKSQLQTMAGEEKVGASDTMFPSETLGWGRLQGERNPLGPWW